MTTLANNQEERPRSMMRAALLLVLAILVLAACRETEPTPTGTAAPVSTRQAPATPSAPSTPVPGMVQTAVPALPSAPVVAATPVAQQGGRLRIATRTVLEDLDVHRSSAPSLAAFGPGIVYSRLLRFASGPEVQTPSLALECDLCESWVWEDTATLRVSLREGVRWQDASPVNGRILSPHDVTASFTRQRTAGWPHARLLANVASMEVEGNDVVFTLRSPDADFPLALADGHTKVVPSELVEMGDLGEGPFIGTGPWVAGEVRPDHRYTFTPNPTYFEPGMPLLESLVIRVLPDAAFRNGAFLTQSLDVDEVTPEYFETYRERNPRAGFVRYEPPGGGSELALNVNDPALRDADFRRAIFRALDPWSLNGQVWHGLAEVTGGMPVAVAGLAPDGSRAARAPRRPGRRAGAARGFRRRAAHVRAAGRRLRRPPPDLQPRHPRATAGGGLPGFPDTPQPRSVRRPGVAAGRLPGLPGPASTAERAQQLPHRPGSQRGGRQQDGLRVVDAGRARSTHRRGSSTRRCVAASRGRRR